MLLVDGTNRKERGQVLVLAVFFLSLASTLMLGLFQVSMTVQEKVRLQISADMAVLSTLNTQANALNSIAISNRAILANDALAGQFNALVSETTFYRRLVEKFQKLLRFVPYAGPVSHFISVGIHTIEKAIRRASSISLPIARYLNIALMKGQESVRLLIPVLSLNTARKVLQENMNGAEISRISQTLALQQSRSLQNCLIPLDPENVKALKEKTMDRHTLNRNWSVRVAGMSPVRKTGSTSVTTDDLLSRDDLRIKVFKRMRWRWKKVLSAKSNASDFGYRTPAKLLSLDHKFIPSAFSLSMMVSYKRPPSIFKSPFTDKRLFVLTAGRITYRRKTRSDEKPNLFNPFWESELMAVASETNAERLIPERVLREVKH